MPDRLKGYCPVCRDGRLPSEAGMVPILCPAHAREAWLALAYGGERRTGRRDRRVRDELGPWKVRGERRRRDRRRAP